MLKRFSMPLVLIFVLVLCLSAGPAFSAETVDVVVHVENQSGEKVGFEIGPLVYTSWDVDQLLSPGQKVDFKHTETLSAGGATITYELYVSKMTSEASCQFAFRFDHGGSRQLILGEPEFRNCQFDSSITHTAIKEGNTMKATIIIK